MHMIDRGIRHKQVHAHASTACRYHSMALHAVDQASADMTLHAAPAAPQPKLMMKPDVHTASLARVTNTGCICKLWAYLMPLTEPDLPNTSVP